MGFGLVSFASSTLLVVECATLEHWVLANDKFLHHTMREFVPVAVCK